MRQSVRVGCVRAERELVELPQTAVDIERRMRVRGNEERGAVERQVGLGAGTSAANCSVDSTA